MHQLLASHVFALMLLQHPLRRRFDLMCANVTEHYTVLTLTFQTQPDEGFPMTVVHISAQLSYMGRAGPSMKQLLQTGCVQFYPSTPWLRKGIGSQSRIVEERTVVH